MDEIQRAQAAEGHVYIYNILSPDFTAQHADDCPCIVNPEGWY